MCLNIPRKLHVHTTNQTEQKNPKRYKKYITGKITMEQTKQILPTHCKCYATVNLLTTYCCEAQSFNTTVLQ